MITLKIYEINHMIINSISESEKRIKKMIYNLFIMWKKSSAIEWEMPTN